MYKEVSECVRYIIINEPLARSNDNYLILSYLKMNNLPTNLEDLVHSSVSFETITRARRKWQKLYPELCSNKAVGELRKELFDQIKADSLGVSYE